ncbi:isoleucine--tRNA ligase [Candidatus Amesbacteria bacterium RIFCSPHIGHO2_01_FULL_47_34]|uniref:Isoleucine--tRNA ligase n=2 Tax=Candidatus Amesiibacteriota TaxID=1752730 RepID=A0A0G1V4N1_9BACT|nr:MAG: isoleucyl-tRNA synthetase, isoleucyl-tRNA synthetase [Candidatus Amesbacteria bacterium GW2011_GWC1_47_15]OGC99792.1 MAG: isoleucine--tRNA ligase [Candidatus Amesbacteria bacterium RIFCSPHIGHO2_01_FULL_47_34]OGD01208.1 MAG: isoleucine--tRNA ligase [Candidatus Amesbacteria bacterium RIFCSPLOWO2_01_FULL_47_33]
MVFKPVSPQVDFPALEREILRWWYDSGIVEKYLHKNDSSQKTFSFLDGPITANNPMGVHHAWGRTYKDLWQRYYTYLGYKQRYQNGFDCQGLWVEVEVEKDLGFKSKKDIEDYGVANFVNKCKERVYKYSSIQTDQSKRLGYFMDWDKSYFTMSDENNYSIWQFLKVCYDRGWVYKGLDSVPWCPRCETAISQHEMLTEDYKEVTHKSIYLKLPVIGRENEFLLVWTTTPWTLPANIAVTVDPKIDYTLVKGNSGFNFWVAKDLVETVFKSGYAALLKTVPGKKLLGLKYRGPFDDLLAVKQVSEHPLFHTVVASDPRIMPISVEEGTGLVHTAVSAGVEDFKLGQKIGLPLIEVIADNADYLPGLDWLAGQNAKKHPEIILDYLSDKDSKGENWVFHIHNFTHRYPACWRCKTELVWKVAQEWYIAMDKPDPTHAKGLTLRKQMISVAKKIKWLPDFGLDRELDWLDNMHDWLISKKNRYWGLALPVYECPSCGKFEVIGGKDELKSRAVSGWELFEGNSPHRPWIDEVKIKCTDCGEPVPRIHDVGNPWLDAGIVSFSTLPSGWFPADFITESFPGQFKNWFYSLLAMGTVLAKTNPFKTVLGFASLLAEDGRPMHKSWGNSIEFNEGADKIGVDVMRWMFSTQNPESNLLFGYQKADETRRRFILTLWNVYNFFVTYANLDNFRPQYPLPATHYSILDRWILVRLNQTLKLVTQSLDKYDAYTASRTIEELVSDLSLWYVRRSRERVGPSAQDSKDKEASHFTLYTLLTTLCRLLAPFTPFISEEIYRNLSGEESVHLSSWPAGSKMSKQDTRLVEDMKYVRKIVEKALSVRKESGTRVRQPLRTLTVFSPQDPLVPELNQLLLDEVNVKSLVWQKAADLSVSLDLDLDSELVEEGKARELIRRIQEERKRLNARLDQPIRLRAPLPDSRELIEKIKIQTLATEFFPGENIVVELI